MKWSIETDTDYLRRTGLEATLFVSRAAAGTRLTVLYVPRRWAPTSGERVAAWLHGQTTAKDEQRAQKQRQTARGRGRIDFRCFRDAASTKAGTPLVVDTSWTAAAATGTIVGDRIGIHRHSAGRRNCSAADCRPSVKGDAGVSKNIS